MSTFYPGIEITCPQSRTCGMQLESYLYQSNAIFIILAHLKKKKWPHDVIIRNQFK